jgi:von Willebrand factor type A domain
MPIQQKVAKIKGVADIVFCIDATGSMQNCIDGVKNNVHNFAASIKTASANTKVNWRARILGYRDFNADTEYLLNNFDFVSTPEELKNQLDKVIAEGGDDAPESTLDAIVYATMKSNWRTPCHKTIVVFTDAPPIAHLHSKTTTELSIPDDIDLIKQTLDEKHIKLFLFGPQDPIYEEMSKWSRTVITQLENAEEGLKSADFKSILNLIAKTVSEGALSGGVL